ncbi:MAG: hypothetical protein QOG43_1261, partial [Actinomycetota bacterium]|nr:hypothetical protein [Actinomycetota bacterium]
MTLVGESRSDGTRHALDFDCGVKAYPPVTPGGHWRLRWLEEGRRRETTAPSRRNAMSKAADVVARLSQGRPTDLAQAPAELLVTHYLDPARRPVRGRAWSARHREEQEAYCRRFVSPVVAAAELGQLSRLHFNAILAQAGSASVAAHLRRCLSAMVGAGLEEGLLLARQDVLRGVRWAPPAGEGSDDEAGDGHYVEEAEIPTSAAVHALAAAAGERSGLWWRELQPLVVAYSGLRWGEMAALTGDRVDPTRRRITVDRQVVETRHDLALSLPKNRRRRTTMYPAATPGGVDLAALVARRVAEVGPTGLLFPSPKGHWPRRSNYRRNTFEPAATAAGWPKGNDGRRLWTFHSLRHVFATWALAQ